jgi:hypothetical protein
MYRAHFFTYHQSKRSMLRRENRMDEYKWRANWMRILATFLEMYPSPSEEKIDYFPGYYNLNCMLLQSNRK